MRQGTWTLAAAVAAGCAAQPVATTRPTTSGVLAHVIWYQDAKSQMRFAYPDSWHPVTDDTVLTLVPVGESKIGLHTVVIDEPDLPPHFPGLIPLGLVEAGFVADVQSRYKQVVLTPSTERLLAGVKGRFVQAKGKGDLGERVVVALLCVRGDHVFLIDAETDAAGAAAARAAFETVVSSMQWMD
ncbi:MAG: hypothetical protein ABSH22_08385 [Tepidisphaeraceae bacterium]